MSSYRTVTDSEKLIRIKELLDIANGGLNRVKYLEEEGIIIYEALNKAIQKILSAKTKDTVDSAAIDMLATFKTDPYINKFFL